MLRLWDAEQVKLRETVEAQARAQERYEKAQAKIKAEKYRAKVEVGPQMLHHTWSGCMCKDLTSEEGVHVTALCAARAPPGRACQAGGGEDRPAQGGAPHTQGVSEGRAA